MKKTLSLVLALITLLAVLPMGVSAEGTGTSRPSLFISYDEYISNQQYYDALVEDYYIININTAGISKEALAQTLYKNTVLTDIPSTDKQPRGSYPPNGSRNVDVYGSVPIDGQADSGTLYTKYKYFGCTSYKVTLTNDYPAQLNYTFINVDLTGVMVPYYTAILKVTTSSEDVEFYIAFDPPCKVVGSVAKYN